MIKLAIVGYGKMGKEIESLIDKDSFQLIGKYDIDNKIQNSLSALPDVAIEFSAPTSMIENVEFLASKKINIVCGTTGWYDKIDKVKEIVDKNDIGFIYASNFMLGVNIFFQIINEAAKLINKYENYDAAIQEIHHNQKLDRPSGTALEIGKLLLENIKRKEELNKTGEGKINPGQIDINSLRIGNIFGNHKVIFDSLSDTITVEHNAKSRRGFAEGALLAAKFIHNKKGFFKFEEIFTNLI
jgi:4-hydroxy-tetrahydrodipicolinate reductase